MRDARARAPASAASVGPVLRRRAIRRPRPGATERPPHDRPLARDGGEQEEHDEPRSVDPADAGACDGPVADDRQRRGPIGTSTRHGAERGRRPFGDRVCGSPGCSRCPRRRSTPPVPNGFDERRGDGDAGDEDVRALGRRVRRSSSRRARRRAGRSGSCRGRWPERSARRAGARAATDAARPGRDRPTATSATRGAEQLRAHGERRRRRPRTRPAPGATPSGRRRPRRAARQVRPART